MERKWRSRRSIGWAAPASFAAACPRNFSSMGLISPRICRTQNASAGKCQVAVSIGRHCATRSEEHTSELQSLMRISYAVFCLKKKKKTDKKNTKRTEYKDEKKHEKDNS